MNRARVLFKEGLVGEIEIGGKILRWADTAIPPFFEVSYE